MSFSPQNFVLFLVLGFLSPGDLGDWLLLLETGAVSVVASVPTVDSWGSNPPIKDDTWAPAPCTVCIDQLQSVFFFGSGAGGDAVESISRPGIMRWGAAAGSVTAQFGGSI